MGSSRFGSSWAGAWNNQPAAQETTENPGFCRDMEWIRWGRECIRNGWWNFSGAGGLKYLRRLPIASLSKDNGGWQPVNANGQTVKALKNITLGKDAVKQKTPAGG
jgi:hypothetical protein